MTTKEISNKLDFVLLTKDEGREVNGLYACDLLSWVMGRAKLDNMWFTVMGNINSVAVATLADVSAIILTEGADLDEDARERAIQREIAIYSTKLTTAQALVSVSKLIE